MHSARNHPLVVVIDDEAAVRQNVCQALDDVGYATDERDSVSAALAPGIADTALLCVVSDAALHAASDTDRKLFATTCKLIPQVLLLKQASTTKIQAHLLQASATIRVAGNAKYVALITAVVARSQPLRSSRMICHLPWLV